MSTNRLTFGADFEFFIYDKEDRLVPSFSFIKGTKEKPSLLTRDVRRKQSYHYQSDNIMGELNPPYSTGTRQLLENVSYIYKKFNALVLGPKEYKIKPVVSIKIPRELSLLKKSRTIGCSPDMDAHLEGMERPPFDITQLGLNRFSGGHFWIGYSNSINIPPHVVVLFLDFLLGGYLMAKGIDLQGPRRNFYGKAGIFRTKEVGEQVLVEYRTLSSLWTFPFIAYEEGLNKETQEARRQITAALILVENNLRSILVKDLGFANKLYNLLPWIDIKRSIDKEDAVTFKDIYNYFSPLLPYGDNLEKPVLKEDIIMPANNWDALRGALDF